MNVREAAQLPVRGVEAEPGVLCLQERNNGQAWIQGRYVEVKE